MDTFLIQTQDGKIINFKYVIEMEVLDTVASQTQYNQVVAKLDTKPNNLTVVLGNYTELDYAQNVLDNLKENIVVRRTGFYIIVPDEPTPEPNEEQVEE